MAKKPKKKYDRSYQAEYQATPEQKRIRAMRNTARRRAIAKYGKEALKGKDVDHIVPLSKGGTNDQSNLRIVDRSKNRSRNFKKKKS